MDTAGVSETTYAYDSLSLMTSETVDFDDLSSNYTLLYSYQLSGQLKSVTDPFSAVVTYNADSVGRATSVTGSGFGSVSTYASGIKFRAFGAVKEMTYGSADSSVVSFGYDSRQRPDTYQSTSSVISGGYVRKASYEYNADGAAKAVDNISNGSFDQSYKFDHVGRPTYSESGTVTGSEHGDVPAYGQTISYDAFSNMTGRSTSTWGYDAGFTGTYTNGRKTGSGNGVYDASGNIVDRTVSSTVYDRWTFDASGAGSTQTSRRYHGGMGYANYDQTSSIEHTRDGDGQIAKRHEIDVIAYVNYGTVTNEKTFYYIRSTVLGGQVITEVNPDGTKLSTKVYGVGGQLAEQRPSSNVLWRHADPVTGSFSTVDQTGAKYQANTAQFNAEFEPVGGVIPQTDPASDPAVAAIQYRTGGNVFQPEYGCEIDGIMQDGPGPCTKMLSNGVGEPDKNAELPIPIGYWRDYVIASRNYPDGGYWSHNQTRFVPYFNDASVSGQTESRNMTKDEVTRIVNDVKAISKANPDCLGFIQRILARAATNANPNLKLGPTDVILKAFEQNGVVAVTNGEYGGTASGRISRGDAEIRVTSLRTMASGSVRARRHYDRTQQLTQAGTALNESIHLSGEQMYDDQQMSNAVGAELGIAVPDFIGIHGKNNVKKWNTAFSGWWHPKVDAKCLIARVLQSEGL